jgi:hypothetical protein
MTQGIGLFDWYLGIDLLLAMNGVAGE